MSSDKETEARRQNLSFNFKKRIMYIYTYIHTYTHTFFHKENLLFAGVNSERKNKDYGIKPGHRLFYCFLS